MSQVFFTMGWLLHHPFLLFITFTLFFSSAVSANEKERSQPDVGSVAEISKDIDGSLFILNCSECHGFDGNSPDPKWPNLAGFNKEYIVKQLKDFKAGRRTDKEMDEVVRTIPSEEVYEALALYFSLQKNNHLLKIDQLKQNNKSVNLALGKEIYTGKRIEYGIPGCANCHGNKGLGSSDGKYPRLAGQYRQYIVKQMKLFRAKERRNDTPAMMQSISMIMDDEDIESVAAYIESIESN